jgi:hypothetical protein
MEKPGTCREFPTVLRQFPFAFLGLMATLAIAIGAAAGDDGTPSFKSGKNAFKCKLIGYDPDRSLIRVSKGTTSATLIVDKNFKLTVDYQATDRKLTDLPANTYLGVVVNSDRTTLLEVHAMGPVVTRTIDSIDFEKRTLHVLATKKDETLSFVKSVAVTKGKLDLTLDDIKPGVRVSLQLSLDLSKVLAIENCCRR